MILPALLFIVVNTSSEGWAVVSVFLIVRCSRLMSDFCWAFSQWSQCECSASDPGRWLIPGTRNDSLLRMVKSGSTGVSRVQLQVILTARESQLFNLSSVNRFITIFDKAIDSGIICIPQEFDRGICRGAVICV